MKRSTKAAILTTALPAIVFLLSACATTREQSLRQELATALTAFEAQDATIDPAALTSFDDYLQTAFRRNPALRAAFHRWQAALEQLPQARSLMDPTLSGTVFLDQVDARYQVALTQELPAWGVLRLQTKQAGAYVLAAMYAFEAERFELYERVARAFHEYQFLAETIHINEQTLHFLTELETSVEARYRSGAADYSDWIRIRIERERLEDLLETLRDQRRPQSEQLAALLHLEISEPLPWAETVASPSMAPTSLEDLLPLLAELNPELSAMDARLEAAGYAEALARRQGWPRPMIGAEWMVMSGMEGNRDETDLGLMLGMSLPIWRGRIRAERQAAIAEQDAIRQERNDLYNRLRAEISMTLVQFQDAERRMTRLRDSLIPQAEQALTAVRQGYADGRVDFMGLIDAHRTLLDLQLMLARAVADREIALADIGCCVGLIWENTVSEHADVNTTPEEQAP